MCEKITTINHPPSRPVQESGPAGNISSAHQTDPEAALDNFVRCINGQPQTILPDQPVETCLPDYSDHLSAASAPSAKYATVSETEAAAAAAAGDREAVAAGTGGRDAAGASAGAGEAAGTAARSNNWSTIDSAGEEAAAAGGRSIQNELEVPPSYDAAMRGEV